MKYSMGKKNKASTKEIKGVTGGKKPPLQVADEKDESRIKKPAPMVGANMVDQLKGR